VLATAAAAMAGRRRGTTALRRWKLRRDTKRRGRDPLGSDEPIVQGYTGYGGGRCPSHGDGRGGDAPARLARGAEALPAWLASTGGCGEASTVAKEQRGRAWRCSGNGGALGAAAATAVKKEAEG